MTKKEFQQRCNSYDRGRYFAYCEIIAERILPVKTKIREMIKEEPLATDVVHQLYTLQPKIARYLAQLESPED